ncbi:DUF1190 domain-containing protein [Providencia stuartii]|uniref:Uncharacterized protein n=1 Tax=Providencia stuartii TaxID=588 RepID=A0A1S1HSQ1_PROST|nr:DUF1190 domain-containing protein [Providencia sp. 2023EL-00965]ELR5299328.1 DUF1190 domain-containing protein [Providencia stuartii]MDW7588402.1 DUF1190 domain-containing protein [Providencia sp. 2023EL-00965]OHT25275.1 hypothetical protein A3Q29_14355 [Providencia stuartii]
MNKKNKTKYHKRKKKAGYKGYPQLKRVGVSTKEERKGSGLLTLVIMSGAVFFGLRSCDQESEAPKITLFKDTNDCVQAGYNLSFCAQKQEEAQQELIRNMATYSQLDVCENLYGIGNCIQSKRKLSRSQYDQCLAENATPEYCDRLSEQDVYGPKLAGFSIDESPEAVQRYSSTHTHSSGSYYFSRARPFYSTRYEPNVYREVGSSEKWLSDGSNKLKPANYHHNSTRTTSRGGFGNKSKSKGG